MVILYRPEHFRSTRCTISIAQPAPPSCWLICTRAPKVFRNRRFFHGPTSEVLIMPSSPQPQQADARRSVDHPLTPEAQFLAKYGGFVSPDAAGLPAVLQHQPEHTRKYQGQSHPSCSLREYSALQGVVRRSSQRRTHIAQTRFATTNFSLSCLSQPWQHGRC